MCDNRALKDDIRRVIRQRRDSLTADEIAQKSRLIFEKLISLDIYKKAENILVYASMGSEVRTDEIIFDALSEGKNVFCPKCTDTKNGIMEFVKITDIGQLVTGYFGIREPVLTVDSVIFSHNCKMLSKSEFVSHNEKMNESCESHLGDEVMDGLNLMIMPLVAYDDENNRVGYKGGYYDRYLEKNPGFVTCALAFRVQKSEKLIPAEAHDIRPQQIITE